MACTLRRAGFFLATSALCALPHLGFAQPLVINQPANGAGTRYTQFQRSPATDPNTVALVQALRQKIRYVFVLFQENRSFDSYFGSFPGANGLFSDGETLRPTDQTPGFDQPIMNVDGTMGVQRPFLIGPAQHAADLDDIDHAHVRMAAKMDLPGGKGTPLMDKFALVEEQKYTPSGATKPTLKAKQFGELAMAYEDCDTIPLMWDYAARFILFDNMFQTTIGPSTPNAIAMLAGQAGETQWVKHPDKIGTNMPVTADPIPFWGSALDQTPLDDKQRQPANTKREQSGVNGANTSQNLTFASLPLTLAGKGLADAVQGDTRKDTDLADVAQDIPYITGLNKTPFAWRWYEEGYDHEATDPGPAATHLSYIGHHNGAQYFGYISNNPAFSQNMRGLGDFFRDMSADALPEGGGVIYVRGGFNDINGVKPAFNTTAYPPGTPEHDEAALVEKAFAGDDDHPGYADSELSDALVAREVNAIARSKYWGESAIVITYDESEGDYDHVPPRILSFDPAGLPLSRGPRIPLILISPFARAHATSHEEGDHNSVIRLIDQVFDLPPLADLPDELQARLTGQGAAFNGPGGVRQTNLGPHDDQTPGTGDLLSGFDPDRLRGTVPVLPASYAQIDDTVVNTLPHYAGQGCKALGITPVDKQVGYAEPVPADFNPRPATFPR